MSATLDVAISIIGVVVGMLIYEVFVRTLPLRWRLLVVMIALWVAFSAATWLAR